MRRFLFSLGLFVLLCAPALAGNLFPPVGASDGVACTNNQTLKWTGNSLECADPSPGVTIPNCPAGKVLSGITNGVATCVAPSPMVTIPNCPAGKVLSGITNGVATCVALSSLSSCVSVASNGGSWAPTASVACPGGYTLTGGSCDMYRGGDGREISPRTCRPNGNGYYCSEGNSGNCIARAVCCQ